MLEENTKNKQRLIYSLCCPFTNEVHYVGKSTTGMLRPLSHLKSSHSEKIKEWVTLVRSFGEDFYTEDIVQEMYLRIHKYTTYEKIVKDGVLNKGFIYFVLRNLFLNYVQLKSRFEVIRLDDNFDISHDSYAEFENRIEDEIKTWHYYDEILFNLYIDSGMSIRKLAKETGISEKSIFVTLKKYKDLVRDMK